MKATMRATILENKYIPHDPTPKQAEFLLFEGREALYGGAAGGGKSDALLMAALQYVETPNYAAILFRKSYTDLAMPGALMDRAHEWLDGTDAKWNEKKKTWTFPSGATVTFAYLDHVNDRFNYQGSEFHFVGFDELTQFDESNYRYLFSRLRRLKGSKIPIRCRAASNPGGKGHEFVYQRFLVEGPEKGRRFFPATLDDNPHLDREDYLQSLAELDPLTRAQLLKGDWNARVDGNKFKRSWFKIVEEYPKDGRFVRYWDLAATEPKPGKDPDWTAGALMTEKDGQYWIIDIVRDRTTPKGVEALVQSTAMMDGKRVEIFMEQEPGSAGVNNIDHYQREVLKGFTFYGDKTTGSKELRANPLSSAAEAGNLFLVRGTWNSTFIDEAIGFPNDSSHDDQIDAVSGAFSKLAVPKELKRAVLPKIGGLKVK